ncbi:MAG: hypothetical protein AB7P99_17945 [Vicinamibacterales bacterium]
MKQERRAKRKTGSPAVLLAAVLAALFLAADPPRAEAQEVRYLYGPFVLAQTLDLHSTHKALSVGAREINPLMVHPAARYPIKTLATMAILGSAEKVRQRSPRKAFWVVAAITAAQFAIDWNNYRLATNLERQRR